MVRVGESGGEGVEGVGSGKPASKKDEWLTFPAPINDFESDASLDRHKAYSRALLWMQVAGIGRHCQHNQDPEDGSPHRELSYESA